MRKSIGPNIDPCGTPLLIALKEEYVALQYTACDLLVK